MKNKALPVVSIIGCPNVGKSSLFNRFANRKIAITSPESGVTRDRNFHIVDWNKKSFMLVDTGGIILNSKNKIDSYIKDQCILAAKESDLVIFLTDGKTGVSDFDEKAIRVLRPFQDKILLVVNKIDTFELEPNIHEFYSLGLGQPYGVSAIHGKNIGDLLDIVISKLPIKFQNKDIKKVDVKIAVLGRPNSGKSTFINNILKKERMITDDVPGTTRDSIDSELFHNNIQYCLIDTAGLRKKARVRDSRDSIEYFSTLRTQQSIEKCDIALVLFDAKAGIGEQDLKIMNKVIENNKGMIIGINKWDLIEKNTMTFDNFVKELIYKANFISNYFVISLSALKGQRTLKILDMAKVLNDKMKQSFSKKVLSEFLDKITIEKHHPIVSGKKIKFYKIKQDQDRQSRFDVMVNYPSKIQESYVRYLKNRFYEIFDYYGCPLVFNFIAAKKTRSKKLMKTGSE